MKFCDVCIDYEQGDNFYETEKISRRIDFSNIMLLSLILTMLRSSEKSVLWTRMEGHTKLTII